LTAARDRQRTGLAALSGRAALISSGEYEKLVLEFGPMALAAIALALAALTYGGRQDLKREKDR
jgi:hypothetical protein